MIFNREKISFCLKGLLCISWIALWSFWLTDFSKKEEKPAHRKKITYITRIPEEIVLSTKPETPESKPNAKKTNETNKSVVNKKITNSLEKTKQIALQNKLEKELPKPVTISKLKSEPEKNKIVPPSKNNKSEPEKTKTLEMINLTLPQTASATRKALIVKEPVTINKNTAPLRKGAKIEREKLKPVSPNIKERNLDDLGQKLYLTDSWLTKRENNETEFKAENKTDNSDKIAEEIELAGIVNKPNGQTTVIIKNKLNNYIEVLKKGDEYKGLKLIEINRNEIVLGNSSLTKTYIKKINMGK